MHVFSTVNFTTVTVEYIFNSVLHEIYKTFTPSFTDAFTTFAGEIYYKMNSL